MKLVVTVPWHREFLLELQAAHPEVDMVFGQDRDETVLAIADAEVAFGHLTREMFLAARQLRWVQCQGAGVDWMMRIPELIASDIIVTNTSGAHAATIAEHTFGMLISLTRGLHTLYRAQTQKHWIRRLDPPATGLSGMTMGIIGLGNIGRAIAKRSAAFDMHVIAVDANPVLQPDYVAEVRSLEGLPDLMRRSDVIVVCVPLTAESTGMIGAEQLALVKPDAYLLAISRGGIVNEPALIDALRSGRLAGAGLDVQQHEPMADDDPLWDAPNLLITPHCSGQSRQTTAHASGIFRENLRRYLTGQPLTNLVDKQRGY